jgi:SsrA-binding protein
MAALAYNKYALYNYEVLDQFEAGIILYGWEVKSIKDGRISLKESYIVARNNKLFLVSSHVAPWPGVKTTTLEQNRDRELMLHRSELNKVQGALHIKGNTAIVVNLHLGHNKIKVQIAIAKGTKTYDKRAKLKEKDQKMEIQRDLKHYS